MEIHELVAAGALAGFLGFGGVSLAGAQETTEDTTATTEAPAEDEATTEDGATTEADGAEKEGCDEDDATADPSDDATVEGSSL